MAVPKDPDHEVTVRPSTAGQPPVRDGVLAERLVTVLFDTGIEEWRRGWRRSPGAAPSSEAIVALSDTTRGATATTQTVPGAGVAYTILDESVTLDRVLDAVSAHLAGPEGRSTSILLDDIAPLLDDRGVAATREFVVALRELAGETDIVVGCSYRPAMAAAIRSLFESPDAVDRIDHPAVDAVDELQEDDPTTFGYVRRHWAEARDGIERCTRNYPQSRQVHAALRNPETTPRTLGAALSGLVRLGVLDTWGETVGPTRYDLTAYDPDRMWVVAAVLSAAARASGSDGSTATDRDD